MSISKWLLMSLYYGIHTIELFLRNLKYMEVQKVIDHLEAEGKIQKIKNDPYNIDRTVKSTYFVNDGIRLRIYQSHNKSNGIGFAITPCTLLSGKYQPIALWKPTPEAVDNLLKRLLSVFEMLGLDSSHLRDLSLSQMDITQNDWGSSGYMPTEIIRQFRKGIVPPNFKVYPNNNKALNPYLYVIESKRKKSKKSEIPKTGRVVVKVYDKVHELEKNGRCPKSLKDEQILRFEVSMKREAFLKKLDLERDVPLYEMLCAGYDQGKDILADYQEKMYPFPTKIVSYVVAKKLIQEKVKDSSLQEQMLYLLEKTSDSAGVSTAVRKLKEHYSDVDNRRIKRIFAEFDKLDIAPIAQPKP